MPTARPLVSEGANPAEGVCAFGKIEVVFRTLGLGLENASFCCQAIRSVLNPCSPCAGTRALKSSSRQAGFNSSKKRLGSQLFNVPQRYRDVAYERCNFFSARV